MNIKQWQWLWGAVVLAAACLIILFESGILPEGFFCGCDAWQYACEVTTLALTLVGLVTGMKSPHRPWLRFACFALPLMASLLVYYLFYSSTTLACAAAVGVAMLLLWPRAVTPEI